MDFISILRKVIFSRISACAIGIILQLGYLAALFWTLGTMFSYSYIIFAVIGFCLTLYIINHDRTPEYKLIWVFTVLSFPVFGIMLYIFFGISRKPPALPREKKPAISPYMQELVQLNPACAKQAQYIEKSCGYAVASGDEITYFKNGETLFPELLRALKKAEKFIFLEFFILEHGVMWDSILGVLEKKAAEGVDVRVIYDDMGSLMTLPRGYRKELERKNIRCCVFGRLKPFWSRYMNNRDHRKIIVIDAKTAVTGGINLADEYINAYKKHGYWKDSAVIIKGLSVKCFTKEFLKLWHTLSDDISVDTSYLIPQDRLDNKGFALPFFDCPDDGEPTAENVYINMLNSAQRYVYITTPYLIPDSKMEEALILAAKNGVDIRIITPHIPDKKFVFEVTRSNYKRLIQNGIKIYEFLPGFIHAKNFVSDDISAVVGSVNLDFRSLYLHYECGLWFSGNDAVSHVKEDFLNALKDCHEVTADETNEKSLIKQIFTSVLRLFSPLM